MMDDTGVDLPRQNNKELMRIFIQYRAKGQDLASLN